MAILKHDDEHVARPGSRRLTWLALAPVVVALSFAAFIGWVWCSSEPVAVGRYRFVGPRCTGSAMYVLTSGSTASVWITASNPGVPILSGPLTRPPIFARGAMTTPTGMQAWAWINAVNGRAFRVLWQGNGFAILEEGK